MARETAEEPVGSQADAGSSETTARTELSVSLRPQTIDDLAAAYPDLLTVPQQIVRAIHDGIELQSAAAYTIDRRPRDPPADEGDRDKRTIQVEQNTLDELERVYHGIAGDTYRVRNAILDGLEFRRADRVHVERRD